MHQQGKELLCDRFCSSQLLSLEKSDLVEGSWVGGSHALCNGLLRQVKAISCLIAMFCVQMYTFFLPLFDFITKYYTF